MARHPLPLALPLESSSFLRLYQQQLGPEQNRKLEFFFERSTAFETQPRQLVRMELPPIVQGYYIHWYSSTNAGRISYIGLTTTQDYRTSLNGLLSFYLHIAELIHQRISSLPRKHFFLQWFFYCCLIHYLLQRLRISRKRSCPRIIKRIKPGQAV